MRNATERGNIGRERHACHGVRPSPGGVPYAIAAQTKLSVLFDQIISNLPSNAEWTCSYCVPRIIAHLLAENIAVTLRLSLGDSALKGCSVLCISLPQSQASCVAVRHLTHHRAILGDAHVCYSHRFLILNLSFLRTSRSYFKDGERYQHWS